MNPKLLINDHSRDIAGLKYVYPVISRRSGGLSIGINVNTNNACNWRCVYCQVADLVRGSAPNLDFQILEEELRYFLHEVLYGDFYDKFEVSPSLRVIKDIAISGNGEPTSLASFDKLIELIGGIASEIGIFPESDFVLITNGSLINRVHVQRGLKILNHYKGKVWFKLDSATREGRKAINNSKLSTENILNGLKISAALCETSLQTCMIDFLEEQESINEHKEYIELLKRIKKDKVGIKKVMLYTLARPSLQPEASKIKKSTIEQMTLFSEQIRNLDYFEVSISV